MKQIIFILLTSLLFISVNSLKADVVTISGRQIFVNNSVYTIKGICYHPVPKGSDKRNFSNLTADLALMTEAGINTIRVYAPIEEKEVLDQIQAAGLKVIIGFGYNQGGKNDILSGTFADYVNRFKNHDAILFWELGNEYNYHPEWFGGDLKNWYTALNNAAEIIHQTDPSHPVATAHGELPDSLALALCPNIDIWGMNVYRWDKPETIFTEWSAVSSKPMYLSEAGADSYMTIEKDGYQQGENEKAQADATHLILDAIFRHPEICSGVALFAFHDEWWKAGNNDKQDPGGWAPNSSGVPYDGAPNEEYWGIVDIDRNKKMVFEVVKEKYTNVSKANNTKNMTRILKNENLEIHIDLPLENYNLSRFDWTGKIVAVKYKGVYVTGVEKMNIADDTNYGKGFYNEFGIEVPVAYEEASKGEWFHKIGIGLLKKDDEQYSFSKNYEIQPAEFKITSESDKVIIACKSQNVNGYSYELKKEIELLESGFIIKYSLHNTGKKTISTNEYNHNFLAINNDLVSSNYVLKFPFEIKSALFDATVNPERKVEIRQNEITFNGTPGEPFFFSNLSGGEKVNATWELINTKNNIGISETGSFKTTKINLWGSTHVISPELFFDVNVEPGRIIEWSRKYRVYEIN
jgi:exo-beta-1,3-glucanase (GH17 family)